MTPAAATASGSARGRGVATAGAPMSEITPGARRIREVDQEIRLDRLGAVLLARPDGDRQPVLRRAERADPARVVRARRVVGEVEVEDEAAVLFAQVGALDRVEQVPAAAVGLAARRGVGEREEDAAAVGVEPEERELLRRSPRARTAPRRSAGSGRPRRRSPRPRGPCRLPARPPRAREAPGRSRSRRARRTPPGLRPRAATADARERAGRARGATRARRPRGRPPRVLRRRPRRRGVSSRGARARPRHTVFQAPSQEPRATRRTA